MQRYLIICLLSALATACAGSQPNADDGLSASTPLPQSSPQTKLDGLPTCEGYPNKLNDGQQVVIEGLMSVTSGSIQQVECVGASEPKGAFVLVHIKLTRQMSYNSEIIEQEGDVELQQTGAGWEAPHSLGLDFSLVPTDRQRQADRANARQTVEAQSAQATARDAAYQASSKATADAEPSVVSLRSTTLGQLLGGQYGFPYWLAEMEVENTSTQCCIHYDIELVIRLSDGTEQRYRNSDCCNSLEHPADPGITQDSTYLNASDDNLTDQACFEDCESRMAALANGARVVRARLLFSNATVAGPWVEQ